MKATRVRLLWWQIRVRIYVNRNQASSNYYRLPKYTLSSFSTHFNIFKTIKHEFCCEISELQMLTIKRTFSHSQQIMKNGNNEHDGILLLQRFY